MTAEKNWEKSSKAVEPSMACEILQNVKDSGCSVKGWCVGW